MLTAKGLTGNHVHSALAINVLHAIDNVEDTLPPIDAEFFASREGHQAIVNDASELFQGIALPCGDKLAGCSGGCARKMETVEHV
jgi:hypothetical protein